MEYIGYWRTGLKKLMSLNLMKTYYINFTVKNNIVREIGGIGTVLLNTNYIKFLGLTIQNDITWDGHIDDIIKKINTACYMIRSVKPVVSVKILKSVYYSYVGFMSVSLLQRQPTPLEYL